MSTLKQLLNDRKITKLQYQAALNYRLPKLSQFDGNLWVTNDKNQRLLIGRRGAILFDGKQLTGK